MHYRYAAAMTDDPAKRRQMLDLAFMFQRMARDFKEHEERQTKLVDAREEPEFAKFRAVTLEASPSR